MNVLKQFDPNTSMPNANVRRMAVGFDTIASAASLKLARSSPALRTSGGVSRMKIASASVQMMPAAPNPQNAQRQPMSGQYSLSSPERTLARTMPK